MAEVLKKMRLRDGKRHTHDGVALKPGDVVDLNPAQVLAFADKFQPASKAWSPAVEETEEQTPQPTVQPGIGPDGPPPPDNVPASASVPPTTPPKDNVQIPAVGASTTTK